MKKRLEALKARLYEKQAESQSTGTIIGILIAVVAGALILTFIVGLLAKDGKISSKVNDEIDTKFSPTLGS